MKKSMIMSLSLHQQSAIGLLASPRYTNGQRTLRRTSWVVWKTSQHHCIFILITVIIILITIISIDIVIYHCINRHIIYNRRFLSIVFRRRYRPCLPSASRPTPQLRLRRAGFAGILCRPRFCIHPFVIITIFGHLISPNQYHRSCHYHNRYHKHVATAAFGSQLRAATALSPPIRTDLLPCRSL